MMPQVIDARQAAAYAGCSRDLPAAFTEQRTMSNAAAVAQAYLDTWNEPNPTRRAELLGQHWAPQAQYVDPLMAGVGHAQISALVDAVHQRFPGFRFRLAGVPDGHGDHLRLAWTLGPDGAPPPIEGSDTVQLHQGRIAQVVGFIDKAPAGATAA
jgi:hypothetical protein